MNVRKVGLCPIVGRAGVTVSVTGTCSVEFVAPGAVRVIIAVYVFARSPEVFTLTVTTSVSLVVVPEVGLRPSQAAVSLAVQLKVAPPVFVMFNVWVAGFVPPSIPVNVRLDGLWLVVGGTFLAWPGGVTLEPLNQLTF